MSPGRVLSLAVAAAAALAGCSEDPGTIRLPLVLETFEERCGDLPCAWSPLPGSEGAVRRVRTVHPGVHGLRLEGDGVGATGPARVVGVSASGGFGRGPQVVYLPPPWEAPLGVQVTGSCDAGGAVEVAVTASVGAEAAETPPVSVTYRGVVSPGVRFAPPARGLLLADPPAARPSDDAVVLEGEVVELLKTGPGACDVALLAVGSVDG